MSNSIVIDSITHAWSRTKAVLFNGFNPGRWLKYGFVAMLGAAVVRGFGATGYSPPVQLPRFGGEFERDRLNTIGPEVIGQAMAALRWIAANIMHLLLLGLGLMIVWLILLVLFLYVRSVFRFIFIECVAAEREPLVGRSWFRHRERGLSLLLWYIFMGLMQFALIAFTLPPVLAGMILIASGEAPVVALGVGGIIAAVGVLILALLVLALLRALTEDLLIPAMYAGRCGLREGWRNVVRACGGHLWDVILFYLLKFVLGIGAGIVGGMISLFSAVLLVLPVIVLAGLGAAIAASGVDPKVALIVMSGPLFIVTGLGGIAYAYILQVFLLPISVFFQAYSLSFVGRMDPALRTI